ncbi:glutaredoxin 3 [Thermodesulfobacteriota bacterium]
MKKIIIYTTKDCPYCIKAKRLLDDKEVEYMELRVNENPELAVEAREKSGGMRTVPQIFIGDYHVGGCDELYALNMENKLDGLLEK